MKQSIFFIGIGGSGMNGIARIMNNMGHCVSGSDRDHDKGNRPDFYQELVASGIQLFSQDGSGIHHDLDFVVASTAVESTIPDVKAAQEKGIPIIHRSDALNELTQSMRCIAVAGTSGKSTVTGFCAWGMKKAGLDPTVINGAKIIGITDLGEDSEFLCGNSSWAIYEADESDGSLKKYKPEIGILTNISKDHLSIAELTEIFKIYIGNIKDTLIFNSRCHLSSRLSSFARKRLSFGFTTDSDFHIVDPFFEGLTSGGRLEGKRFQINLPGYYNLENALAAYTLLRFLGRSSPESIDALEGFRGIQRRFQLIGTQNDITVIDDFAHNPDKIHATMSVAGAQSPRVIYVYQPHGFGPTRFLFEDIVDQFADGLREKDTLILAPIFYAGGTAGKTVSSDELAASIRSRGKEAVAVERGSIPFLVSKIVNKGDWVVVMGARDPSLPELCRSILQKLTKNFSE